VWTEERIVTLLRKRFPAPAFACLPQLRNGTGFQRRTTRTADLLAVSCYPSRGLYFVGVEIKVTRGDWLRELAQPVKAEEFQKYCRHWYVAAPAGLLSPDELPPTWGLIACQAASTQIAKPAATLQPVPPDLLFVCAILRKVAEAYLPKTEVQEHVSAQAQREAEAKLTVLQHQLTTLQAQVAEFEAASGVSLGNSWQTPAIGAAVQFVQKVGAARAVRESLNLAQQHERWAKQIRLTVAQLQLELPEPTAD
jgi:hypothetical protein